MTREQVIAYTLEDATSADLLPTRTGQERSMTSSLAGREMPNEARLHRIPTGGVE